MHGALFYAAEFAVILLGIVLVHRFVCSRRMKYDSGSLYLSMLAATFIWVVAVSMHLLGIGAGFLCGIVAGGMAVAALDTAVGLLYNAGY